MTRLTTQDNESIKKRETRTVVRNSHAREQMHISKIKTRQCFYISFKLAISHLFLMYNVAKDNNIVLGVPGRPN